MPNSLLFLLWILVDLSLLLGAFSLWGRTGVVGVIAANAVMMNLFVLKGMVLFGLDATGGNVLYAAVFLGTDVVSEYAGPREARRAVFIGFFVSLSFLVASRFILLFEPAPWDRFHGPMEALFSPVWRIVAASMLAYLVSQNLDITTYTRIRKKFPAPLWLRNNGSTLTSQAVDTVIFCSAAFAGVYELPVVMGIMLSTYLLKAAVALIDTPFLYLTRLIVRLRPELDEQRSAPPRNRP